MTGMDLSAHALINSVRNAPANVSVIVRIGGRVFAFRWIGGRLVSREIRRSEYVGAQRGAGDPAGGRGLDSDGARHR